MNFRILPLSLALSVALATVAGAASAQERKGAGDQPDVTQAPPPRTINDIMAVLEQNRGDTAAMKKAREWAD